MTRRRLQFTIHWLLPLLVLRLMLPSGIMPAYELQGIKLVFCSGLVQLPQDDLGHSGQPSSAHSDVLCPFAAAAAPAPLPEKFGVSLALAAAGPGAPLSIRSHSSEVPLRHTAPRGPPSFA